MSLLQNPIFRRKSLYTKASISQLLAVGGAKWLTIGVTWTILTTETTTTSKAETTSNFLFFNYLN